MQHTNQIPERVLELRDLFEFALVLNEVGFNLSTEDLEREARGYGFNLASLATRGKDVRSL